MIFQFFSSLRLTVWLLALSTAMVFFGTLEQVHVGIRGAQAEYFESLLAIWAYPQQWPLYEFFGWIHLPIPGGYLLGPMLIVNLCCAHFRYFKPGLKKAGIAMIHGGVVVLLAGQLYTQLVQEESIMWVREGKQANYLERFHSDELAIIDTTSPEKDSVVAVPSGLLKDGKTITHEELPFTVTVEKFFKNAKIGMVAPAEAPPPPTTHGIGARSGIVIQEAPVTYKMDDRNRTSAIVSIKGDDGTDVGQWLVSNVFVENKLQPQVFEYDGRQFRVEVRYEREYLPYSIELIDFEHDYYAGTDIPTNYSSKVRILDMARNTDRETLIYMNHPLRHAGLTFYQYQFRIEGSQDGGSAEFSAFQVVRNPGWLVPYVACLLVTLGLAWQFILGLYTHMGRRRA